MLPLKERLSLLRHLLPAFVIFSIVMGSIYFGLATPTEAAALGIIAALVLAKCFGQLTLPVLHHCFKQTAVLTGMIILIMAGDRKSVGWGTSVSVRVDIGGRGIIKKK